MRFSEICDWIVLIGAVIIALKNIWNFVAKPGKKIKDKRDEEVKAQVNAALDEKMPEILRQHEEEAKENFHEEKIKIIQEVKEEVVKDISETLEGIWHLNLEQNEFIEALITSSKDMLRQRIMTIYHTYKKEKRMPIHAREALDELYKDYKAENGNSYIDKYYKRMKLWETYDDEEEDDEE